MSWSDNFNDYILQRVDGNFEDSEDSEGSQYSQETDSSQEVTTTEHLNPWSRILGEAQERHEVQLNALSMSTRGRESRKMWLTLKRRTLSFLSTEKK